MAASANKFNELHILGPHNHRASKGPDISNLRPPIHTSVTGMKQAVHALETGSLEVKRCLLNEANLIYECKVCLSMFRSIANLVAHKRAFCKQVYTQVRHTFSDQEDKENTVEVVVEPEDAGCSTDLHTWNMDNYSPSMDLIRTSGIIGEILNAPLVNKLNPHNINSVAHRLTAAAKHSDNSSSSEYRSRRSVPPPPASADAKLVLEPMHNTTNALIQSWKVTSDTESVKKVLKDLDEIKFSNKHVIIVGDDHGEAHAQPDAIDEVADDRPVERETVCGAGYNGDDDGLMVRYPCFMCTNHYPCWGSLRRHIIRTHKQDPEFASSKRTSVMEKAFHVPRSNYPGKKPSLVVAAAEKPLPAEQASTASAVSKQPALKVTPVKPVQVDIARMPIDLGQFCKSVATSSEEGCPVLKNKVGSVPSNPSSSNSNGSPPHSSRPKRVVNVEPIEEDIPEDVHNKIMEGINRRHLQCTACFKRFRRTHLAKQHVAAAHLKLARFKCTICDFGTWKRSHVIRHAEKNHRSRTNQTHVVEQPKEVYFAKYLVQKNAEEEKQLAAGGDSKPMPPLQRPPGGTLLRHNFVDLGLDNQNNSTNSCHDLVDTGRQSFDLQTVGQDKTDTGRWPAGQLAVGQDRADPDRRSAGQQTASQDKADPARQPAGQQAAGQADDMVPVSLINGLRPHARKSEDETLTDDDEISFSNSPKRKRKRFSGNVALQERNNLANSNLDKESCLVSRSTRQSLWSPSKAVQPEEKSSEKGYRGGVRTSRPSDNDDVPDRASTRTRQRIYLS